MASLNAVDEDWDLLISFFPSDWKTSALRTGALKGLRQDKSEENYLRTLLMHLGGGFSLRETAVRARQAELADLSDVALLKCLRKGKDWLYELCRGLFAERGLQAPDNQGVGLRLMDATVVKEPGQTGSQWRIHYSFQWPALRCDYFKLTATEGKGTGETLRQYPVSPGDLILVDLGYCQAAGIHHVAGGKAWVTVRLNPHSIILHTQADEDFPLLRKLKTIQRTGQIATWKVRVPYENQEPVVARICVVRKSKAAIAHAIKKLEREASKNGSQLQPETLIYAEYIMVLTTFPEDQYPSVMILEWYRFRWQIELLFKRFKQIAQLGHLPKHDDESAQAWLYGKLFVTLLTEKVIEHASALSPWGYRLQARTITQSVA
ncbi:MAG: IS4 family transposase [Verrucomicrobiota bacterium]